MTVPGARAVAEKPEPVEVTTEAPPPRRLPWWSSYAPDVLMAAALVVAAFFARRGYACVVQRSRGGHDMSRTFAEPIEGAVAAPASIADSTAGHNARRHIVALLRYDHPPIE